MRIYQRNYQKALVAPSRGAWIEMFTTHKLRQLPFVAPLAGGVD